ncbi:hypothetical protein [Vibrio sp. 10N.247.311.51]|uniref:hypothetical protein n=1 Tax=Vibrio sp. 10N.247.311.51 TaxID=3229996 RepID=UPI003553E7F8
MPKSGVNIFCFDELAERENAVWLFCVTYEADEEELESNHKLADIGDIVWQTQIQIQCCPYSGERLPPDLKKRNAVYHHYHSG